MDSCDEQDEQRLCFLVAVLALLKYGHGTMDTIEIIFGVALFVASTGVGAIGWQVKRVVGRLDDLERGMARTCSDRAAVEARQDAQIEAAQVAAAKAEDVAREAEGRLVKRLDEIATKLDRLLER